MTALAPGGDWERQKVHELRSRTPPVPWPHVAAQVARHETDVRRVYDPTFGRDEPEYAAPAITMVATPRPGSGHVVRRAAKSKFIILPGTRMAETAPLLADRSMTAVVVAKHLNCTRVEASSALAALVRKSLVAHVEGKYPPHWFLTDRGREAVALLRGAR